MVLVREACVCVCCVYSWLGSLDVVRSFVPNVFIQQPERCCDFYQLQIFQRLQGMERRQRVVRYTTSALAFAR